MSLPYTALHTFLLVVRYASLKQAADHLSLTESAISHQLKRLESQLGYALFYKSGRQLKTTPQGAELAKQIALPFDQIDHSLSRQQDKQIKGLTLYCLPSLLEVWLLPILLAYKERYPKIDLIVRYDHSAPEYLNGQSLRIRSFDGYDTSQYNVEKLFSGQTLAVCSPLYLSRHQPISEPADLLNHGLLHDHSDHSWNNWFANFDLTLNTSSKLIYEDFHLLKMATLAGQGIALCPQVLIKKELTSGSLVPLFERAGNQDRYYGLEFSQYANSSLHGLIDFIRQQDRQ